MAQKPNLMRADRIGYAAGGAALIAWALRRPGWLRGAAAGVGALLLYQAYTAANPLFRPLGIQVNRRPREALALETIVVEDMVSIARPRAEVFQYWRSPANLPRMPDTEVVIAREDLNEAVAWRAMSGGRLAHFGSIELSDAPGGKTFAAARLEYCPAGGSLGAAISCMTRHSPQRAVADALRRARGILERESV